MKFRKIYNIIREYFLSGLLVVAPVLIVAVVFRWIFGGILGWFEDVPLRFFFTDPSNEFAVVFKALAIGGIVLGGMVFVSGIGFFSRLYFGRKLIKWFREGIEKIPFFGAIYSSVDQLFNALGSSGGKQFSRVVYIEYPRKDVLAVAFVTSPARLRGIPPGYLSVFVPTVPNPTSGFHLMVKETDVIDSGLRVDEAFRLILSLGVAVPMMPEPMNE